MQVFAALREHVPIRVLGKHAAYALSITLQDFREWDAITEDGGHTKGIMTVCALGCMDIFRQGNPELFYKLYDVPEHARNDISWAEHVTTLSHPYDAALVLYVLEPRLFRPVQIALTGGIPHETVGNDPDNVGLVDAEEVRRAIKTAVARGLRPRHT